MAVINNLLNNVEFVVVEASAAAGQSTLTTDTVDTAGWTGVVFVAALGDVTAASALDFAAEHSDESNANFAELAGALTHTADGTNADDKLLILDVVRAEKRYVRATLGRGDANAVVSGIYAIKYGPKETPVAQGETVLGSATLANPKAA